MKKKQVTNVSDVKNNEGIWIKSYCSDNTQYTTRAGKLWSAIKERSKVGGGWQTKFPNYEGTTNGFKGFQEFAEWCQTEFGYLNKDVSGRFWSLDKDLLVKGSKVYSPDTCIFVPNKINCFVNTNNQHYNDYPAGVYFCKSIDKFRAQGTNYAGDRFVLGSFCTPEEAHKAWQINKIQYLDAALVDESLGCKIHGILLKMKLQFMEDVAGCNVSVAW